MFTYNCITHNYRFCTSVLDFCSLFKIMVRFSANSRQQILAITSVSSGLRCIRSYLKNQGTAKFDSAHAASCHSWHLRCEITHDKLDQRSNSVVLIMLLLLLHLPERPWTSSTTQLQLPQIHRIQASHPLANVARGTMTLTWWCQRIIWRHIPIIAFVGNGGTAIFWIFILEWLEKRLLPVYKTKKNKGITTMRCCTRKYLFIFRAQEMSPGRVWWPASCTVLVWDTLG